MTRSVQALAYSRPSALESAPGGRLLGLETSGGLTPAGAQAHPRFFSGFLASPRAAAWPYLSGVLKEANLAASRRAMGSGSSSHTRTDV
ncbi:hypothetical protein ACWCOZ_31390, partial [Streptomyces sp. NPDC001840]